MYKHLVLWVLSSKILELATQLINNAHSPSFNGTLNDNNNKKIVLKLARGLFLPFTLLDLGEVVAV